VNSAQDLLASGFSSFCLGNIAERHGYQTSSCRLHLSEQEPVHNQTCKQEDSFRTCDVKQNRIQQNDDDSAFNGL
jgi:hypothetical protein